MSNDLIIGMAGSGGDGVVSAGEFLITGAALEGYRAILTKSFGSQIRGGESSYRLRISTREVHTPAGVLDVAIALNWDDFLRFGAELPVGEKTIVIYDSKTGIAPEAIPLAVKPAEVVAVPIAEMAKKAARTEKGKNAVVLGLLAGWFGMGQEGILAGMRKKFANKDVDVLAANEHAFASGLAYANENPLRQATRLSPPSEKRPRLLLDGNDMCAAASLFAGCEFFGGYPITPSSEIMQFLSREIWKYGGSLLQAEDEIAGVGAAIGASFAGKKALTATSGPGMSLKTEMLGLASIAEIPLVCVNVQRGGPSTGLPTKSEQSDLFQAIFSAHGDTVRPVLAPTSVADTFCVTVEAFNIAEQYQTPVILLSDQEIGQRKEVVDPIDTSVFHLVERQRPSGTDLEGYQRFRATESGVSPISMPGLKGGAYLAAGIEHDEQGDPTVSGDVHLRMTAKRIEKLSPLKQRRDLFVLEGDPEAPLALISWGSVAGAAREALQLARTAGLAVKLLVPKLLYPVAEDVYREFFASVAAGLVVEQSYQGQLHRVLRMFVDVPDGVESFVRTSATPILAVELAQRLQALAARLPVEHGGVAIDPAQQQLPF